MGAHRSGSGQRHPFLTRLHRSALVGEAELNALGSLFTVPRPVATGTDLSDGRDRAARLHVLLSGWACRYKTLADGGRQITALLLPGDVCNLDRLYIDDADYTVGMLSDCMVASLDCSAVRGLAARHPGVAWGLGWLGAVENAALTEHTACLGRRSARERLAHLLCELFQRLEVTGFTRENGYALPLTQTELSDVLGLTPVHVNRVLQGLRGEGLITLKGGRLTVLDWPLLCAVAEFNPNYLRLGKMDGPDAVRDPPSEAPAPIARSGAKRFSAHGIVQ